MNLTALLWPRYLNVSPTAVELIRIAILSDIIKTSKEQKADSFF